MFKLDLTSMANSRKFFYIDEDILSEREVRFLLQQGVSISGITLNGDVLSVGVDIPEYAEGELEALLNAEDEDEYDWDSDDEESELESGDDSDEDEYGDEYDVEDWDSDDEDSEDDSEEDMDADSDEDDYDWDSDEPVEDDFYDEDDYDWDEEDDSTVTKLYGMLTEEQVKLLKTYYLWYSRELFRNANKDPNMGFTDMVRLERKKNDLNELRGEGGLWHYAGFIDLGYRGAGFCTLGHPLRYMHIACDVEVFDIDNAFYGENYNIKINDIVDSDSSIIFGIKCISDFFEVDAECVKRLQSAQRESLKDMGYLYGIYANNLVEEYNNSLYVMDEICKPILRDLMFGKTIASKIDTGLVRYYMDFRKLNLVPPKSLLQRLRNGLVGWTDHKKSGSILLPITSELTASTILMLGSRYKDIAETVCARYSYTTTLFGAVKDYLTAYFSYESCGLYKYDADKSKDEGGKSRLAKSQYNAIYTSIRYNLFGKEPQVYSKSKIIEFLDFCKRVSDVKELYNNTNFEIRKSLYYTEYEITERLEKEHPELNYSESAIARQVSRLNRWTYAECKENLEGIENTLKAITTNKDKVTEIIAHWDREYETGRKEPQTPKVELDDSKYVDYLKEADLSSFEPANRKLKLALDILDTVKKSKRPPSDSQAYYLKLLYDELTGSNISNVVRVDDRPDLVEAINYALNNSDQFDKKTLDILTSVLQRGTISDRQYKYVQIAEAKYQDSMG